MKLATFAFACISAIDLFSSGLQVKSQSLDQQYRNQETQSANMDTYCKRIRAQSMFTAKYATSIRPSFSGVGGLKVDNGMIYALHSKAMGSFTYPNCEWEPYVRLDEEFKMDRSRGMASGTGLWKLEGNTLCLYKKERSSIEKWCERLERLDY